MTMIFSAVVYCCLLYGLFINSGILAASFQPSPLILEAPQSLEFLKRYGYLSNTNNDGTAEQLYSQESVENAIREAQRFGGIQQTGKLDEETKTLFKSKRCGLPDVTHNSTEINTNNYNHSSHDGHYHKHHAYHHHHHHHQHNHHRNKRYILASRGWEKRHLTYFLENWPPQLNRHDIMSEIRRALHAWAKYGQLTFTEVSSPRDSDITIGFFRGHHGDSYPFDGPGQILGHAFFPSNGDPIRGDIHFDGDENWKINPERFDDAVDFASVLLHELGHSLGLSHSPEPDSIMNPYYTGKGTELGYDDILAMHHLYIAREIPDDDNRVDRDWDDIPRPPTRQPYFPPRYPVPPRVTPRYHETTTLNPIITSSPCTPYLYGDRENDDNEGVHRTVDIDDDDDGDSRRNDDRPYRDESYTPVDSCGNAEEGIDSGSFIRGELFITKGEMLWRLRDAGKVEKDYPVKFHSFFHKLPESVKTIDALYERPDSSIVFFYGRKYWIFDGYNFIEDSPRSISDYGLSEYDERVDAIFYSPEDAYTYVFRGDKYWKFNETTQSGYPSFISDFKGTPSHLNAALIDRNGEVYLFKGDTYWTLDMKQKLARKTGSVFQYWLSS